MILSKNVNNKKCAPKLVFFNEKKIEKDSDNFWHRKLTLKVKFWHFLTPPHYTNLQNSMISFDCSWFLAKNLSNYVSFPWKLHNRYCHNWLMNLKTYQWGYEINARNIINVINHYIRCNALFSAGFNGRLENMCVVKMLHGFWAQVDT